MGDVRDNVRTLLPLLSPQDRSEWFEMIGEWKARHPFSYGGETTGKRGLLKPQYVLDELNTLVQAMPTPPIFTTGVGQHQMWAAQFIRWRQPRTFITSGGLGTMGFGLPAAIGAKIAMPERCVIDIDGDASFAMTLMELLTAAEYNIGVKVLVLNNHFQGMVKQWQDLFYEERYCGTRMFNPCYARLAEAAGCTGLTLARPEDTRRVLEEFLACPGPVVLDVQVDKDEHVYPMVPAGAALHDMVLGPPRQ
jgi:acetolactate synthase-1/2/3 large subunit